MIFIGVPQTLDGSLVIATLFMDHLSNGATTIMFEGVPNYPDRFKMVANC